MKEKNEMNAIQIKDEFISLLNKAGGNKGFYCQPWRGGIRGVGKNIIELSGSINSLIYYKVRSERPFRWGVTYNRIDELELSGRKWFLVLLYESPNTGYLITAQEVNHYLSIWPLGSDGDYKVSTGSYLQFNQPFISFPTFLHSLVNLCK
jgi:hypothetical protein